MKPHTCLLWLLPLCACEKNEVSPQTPAQTDFASATDARAFFIDLADQNHRAIVAHDSAFFANSYAATYYNCTPTGEINNKAADIRNLLSRSWVSIERIAPQYDVFSQNGDVATLLITNRNQVRTRAGVQQAYVRRTLAFQKTGGQWQFIASQGTTLLPATVGQ